MFGNKGKRSTRFDSSLCWMEALSTPHTEEASATSHELIPASKPVADEQEALVDVIRVLEGMSAHDGEQVQPLSVTL